MNVTGELHLEKLDEMLAALRQGVKAAADDLLDRSNAGVPTDSGDLRDSGHVTEESEDMYAVSYGQAGDKTGAYAVRQHEDMSLRHDDGGPKFLEQAAMSGDRILQVIRDTVAGAMQ